MTREQLIVWAQSIESCPCCVEGCVDEILLDPNKPKDDASPDEWAAYLKDIDPDSTSAYAEVRRRPVLS